MDQLARVSTQSEQLLNEWLLSCTRKGKLARNTVAVGIVVLDRLRSSCPVTKTDVMTDAGELKGARSGLRSVLAAYAIPALYLKEATSRQSPQDGEKLYERLQWGQVFAPLSDGERDEVLLRLIDILVSRAQEWLTRQNLRLPIDRHASPAAWVHAIVESARQRSGGVVEQHLIGAKLQRRFPKASIPNHPAHAGDQQTARAGDFVLASLVYHVTASPSDSVIEKCLNNIRAGQHPILLVPRSKLDRARILAQDEHAEDDLTIVSIEDFVALNVIELATDENRSFFDVMNQIVSIYNDRLAEVETDQSLRIQLR